MKNSKPEQWHARVLRDESERLTAACQILEWRDGWFAAGGPQLSSGLNADMLEERKDHGADVGAEAARLATFVGPRAWDYARAGA